MKREHPGSWIDLALVGGEPGREDCQAGWQEWVGALIDGHTILDVGCGLGLSRERLARSGRNQVTLQDPAPVECADTHKTVARFRAGSFDAVTAFDVIEHVRADRKFLAHLRRIARHWVILTTPNWNVSRCANPCHVREYTPAEFLALVEPYPVLLLVAGSSDGRWREELSPQAFLEHTRPHQAAILGEG